MTQGDHLKAKQLVDLIYVRNHAGEQKIEDKANVVAEKQRLLCIAITESIAEFVKALHAAGSDGRYPTKCRQAMQVGATRTAACSVRHAPDLYLRAHASPLQVVATAVSRAALTNGVSYTDVGKAIGLDRRMISKCEERFLALQADGDWEQLFDDRCAERSDKLKDEWKEFALCFWTEETLADGYDNAYNFVRKSERTKDEMRDPNNRKSKETTRVVWLEARIGDMYEAMKKAGVAKFGQTFHMGMTMFTDLRPFYVKDATRETAMCVYHMRWYELCYGFINFRRGLRQHTVHCDCQVPANADAVRKLLICERAPAAPAPRMPAPVPLLSIGEVAGAASASASPAASAAPAAGAAAAPAVAAAAPTIEAAAVSVTSAPTSCADSAPAIETTGLTPAVDAAAQPPLARSRSAAVASGDAQTPAEPSAAAVSGQASKMFTYDNLNCVLQKCPDCSGLKELFSGEGSLCQAERAAASVKQVMAALTSHTLSTLQTLRHLPSSSAHPSPPISL